MWLSPAQLLVSLLGGTRKTAKALGRSPGAVSQWKRKGTIPADILPIAFGLIKNEIEAEELIVGRKVEDPWTVRISQMKSGKLTNDDAHRKGGRHPAIKP